MNDTSVGARDARRIERARDKAGDVRERLEVVGAEIHLTNSILERELPARHKQGDVRKALDQNGAVADKVDDAKEELREVEALLEQEASERRRLEREIGRRV
ncbi:hypothetical protein [Ramlibacter sp.]|uniref:hypothetical protein n=1 Tax=Ramlibacter sp. TaxID=1917967 RepID=UPI002C11428C|nr:hypothetical protein [Ramlibacter sp.]HWI82992.1 hypothetical protein [Ramlibacter sp.]